jgi:hypothetical protein
MSDKKSVEKDNEIFNGDDKDFYQYDNKNNNEFEEHELLKEFINIDKNQIEIKGNNSQDSYGRQKRKNIINSENFDNSSKSKIIKILYFLFFYRKNDELQ